MDDAGEEEEREEAVLTRTPTTHDDDATKSGAKSAAASPVEIKKSWQLDSHVNTCRDIAFLDSLLLHYRNGS